MSYNWVAPVVMGVLSLFGGKKETRTEVVGVSPAEMERVRKEMDYERERSKKMMEMMEDKQKHFEQLQAQLEANERQRAAAQSQMAAEMAKARESHSEDKLKQAQELERLRRDQQSRIERMDADRKLDKEAFESQVLELKKQSAEALKRLSVEQLKERIASLFPFVISERRSLAKVMAAFGEMSKDIAAMQSRIWLEETRLSAFKGVRHDAHCLRLVLYGETGHGKSAVACRLVGDTSADFSRGGFPVSHRITSETRTISAKLVNAETGAKLKYKHKLLVVDLPGANDTGGDVMDERHANRMVQYLKGIGFINLICLVHSQKQLRLGPKSIEMLNALDTTFGVDMWSHVVLVVTNVRSAMDFGSSATEQRRAQTEQRKADEWVADLQKAIRARYELTTRKAPLTAVCIDNTFLRDAVPKCRELVNNYAGRFKTRPFKCDALVSPLDAWNCELQLKQNALRETEKDLAIAVSAVNEAIGQIEKSRRQMEAKGGDCESLSALCGEYRIDAEKLATVSFEVTKQSLLVMPSLPSGSVESAGRSPVSTSAAGGSHRRCRDPPMRYATAAPVLDDEKQFADDSALLYDMGAEHTMAGASVESGFEYDASGYGDYPTRHSAATAVPTVGGSAMDESRFSAEGVLEDEALRIAIASSLREI